MGRPYSRDLRERIVGAVAAGHSRRAAARMFGVSPGAVKLVRRWRGTGSVKPGKMGAPKRCKLDPRGDWLLALVRNEPPNAPSKPSGQPSDACSIASRPTSAGNHFENAGYASS